MLGVIGLSIQLSEKVMYPATPVRNIAQAGTISVPIRAYTFATLSANWNMAIPFKEG